MTMHSIHNAWPFRSGAPLGVPCTRVCVFLAQVQKRPTRTWKPPPENVSGSAFARPIASPERYTRCS